MFCRKGVLRNFTKFTGKHLHQSLFFNKVATLLKKGLWHNCFPVNFPKFLRTPFFTKHLRWLLLLLQDHWKISNTLKSLGSFGNLQGKIKHCAQSCSPIKKKYSYLKADILNFLCRR